MRAQHITALREQDERARLVFVALVVRLPHQLDRLGKIGERVVGVGLEDEFLELWRHAGPLHADDGGNFLDAFDLRLHLDAEADALGHEKDLGAFQFAAFGGNTVPGGLALREHAGNHEAAGGIAIKKLPASFGSIQHE